MATLLLVAIYIAFIGLGVPDSLFGTAWPAICAEWGLPVAFSSIISTTISCGTITSSIFAPKLIHKLGTAKVTIISTALTFVGLLGFRVAPSFALMIASAIPLGIGAGAIDTALNNYATLHYKPIHINFLHCFYGIGVTVSPMLLGIALSSSGGWRSGYAWVSVVQLVIAAVLFLAAPLWSKVKTEADKEYEESEYIGFGTLLKNKQAVLSGLMVLCACAVETTCNAWCATYLVQAKSISVDTAAFMLMIYFGGITSGRIVAGIISSKVSSWKLIVSGLAFMGVAITLLLLPLPNFMFYVTMFLLGLGISPLYPNMLQLTSQCYDKRTAPSVIGLQVTMSNMGILCAPVVFGLIAQFITPALYPIYSAIFYAMLLAVTVAFARLHRKDNV